MQQENDSNKTEGVVDVGSKDLLADSPEWPHVLSFAKRMEAKLSKNRHKGDREGWLKCDVQFLISALKDEVGEMEAAAWEGDADETANECADIANFAMMIADWFVTHAELPQLPNGGQ